MSKMLLLADDSVTIQKVVELIFAHGEYDLKCANNGDAALEQARLARPDLVLADANMPGRNGYELCAAIKADPALKKVPVLMLAGTFEPFDEEKARSAGADSWITKPFESQALIDEVDGLLVRSESSSEEELSESLGSAIETESDIWTDLGFNESDSSVEEEQTTAEQLLGEEDKSEPWIGEGLLVDEPAPAEADPFDSAQPAMETGDSDFPVEEEILFIDESDLLDEEQVEEDSSIADMDVTFDDTEEVEQENFSEPEPEDFLSAPPVEREFVSEPEMTEPQAVQVFSAPDKKHGLDFFRDAGLISRLASPASEETPAAIPVAGLAAGIPDRGALTERDVEQRVEALSEEQLDRIVERVAGTVIERLAGTILEKIAWEVVPDLAEVIIKEEIRKITESSR
jgi:CheY-like chemotaxis protein